MAPLRLVTWEAFVFLRQLQRTFSHPCREQLGSLHPLLGLTHPLWPAKEMRARHRFHVIPPCRVTLDAVNDIPRSGPCRGVRSPTGLIRQPHWLTGKMPALDGLPDVAESLN